VKIDIIQAKDLMRKFQILLVNYNQFDMPALIFTIEKMILAALECGTIMEKRDVIALRADSAANARRHRKVVGEQIDKIIKTAIVRHYPSLISAGTIRKPSRPLTTHGVASGIKGDVSKLLKEKNIRPRKLSVSAITKRVEKLTKLLDD
jgi:hypothetical protein